MKKLLTIMIAGSLTACSGGSGGSSGHPVNITVTGLQGELQLSSGNESVTITTSGSNSFNGLTASSVPAISIDKMPANQNCTFDLNGELQEGQWQYAISCQDKSWTVETEESAKSIDGGSIDLVATELDSKGDGFKIWRQSVGSTTSLWAQRRVGDSWQAAQQLTADGRCTSSQGADESTVQTVNNFDLAVSENGRAVILCEERHSGLASNTRLSTNAVFSKLFALTFDGSEWSLPAASDDHLNSNLSLAYVLFPQAGIANNGDVAFSWRQGNALYMAENRKGVWSIPAVLSLARPSSNELKMNSDGTTVIATVLTNGVITPPVDTYVHHYLDGSWQEVVKLSTSHKDGVKGLGDVDVALSESGQVLVAWNAYLSSASTSLEQRQYLFFSEYNGSEWVTPESEQDGVQQGEIHELNTFSIAMNDNDQALISWNQRTVSESTKDVFISERMGGNWSHKNNSFSAILEEVNHYPSQSVVSNNGDAVVQLFHPQERYDSVVLLHKRNDDWGNLLTVSPVDKAYYDNEPVSLNLSEEGEGFVDWIGEHSVDSKYLLFTSEYR